MPLLQIKLYHAVADVKCSSGPCEDALAENRDADHRPMLNAGVSYLSTSADLNLCHLLLSSHLSHHNVLARVAAGAGERCQPPRGSRRGGAVAAAARKPTRGATAVGAQE